MWSWKVKQHAYTITCLFQLCITKSVNFFTKKRRPWTFQSNSTEIPLYSCTFWMNKSSKRNMSIVKVLNSKRKDIRRLKGSYSWFKTKGAYGTSDDDFGSRRLMRIDLILREEVTRAERLTFMCGDEQRTKGENK